MALLPELDVRTVLNVVEENFQRLNLKTYAIRMIYIGEHTLPKEEIIQLFKQTVHAVNASYCEIHIGGLLLVYDSYFVHIIEGSEDTVHRQIRFLFKSELDWIQEIDRRDEEAARLAANEASAEGLNVILEENPVKPERVVFKGLKMLMVYHSIKTLVFNDWQAVTAQPPSLVGKLDIYGPLAAHMEQLRICLDKVKILCQLTRLPEPLSFEGLSAVDPKMGGLPEVALLDFLLHSTYILDLRSVAHMHRRVDDYRFYFECVWPLATHYTPRLLYKLKVDDSFVEQLPVMPWELVKKEAAEDEEREEQSASSASD